MRRWNWITNPTLLPNIRRGPRRAVCFLIRMCMVLNSKAETVGRAGEYRRWSQQTEGSAATETQGSTAVASGDSFSANYVKFPPPIQELRGSELHERPAGEKSRHICKLHYRCLPTSNQGHTIIGTAKQNAKTGRRKIHRERSVIGHEEEPRFLRCRPASLKTLMHVNGQRLEEAPA